MAATCTAVAASAIIANATTDNLCLQPYMFTALLVTTYDILCLLQTVHVPKTTPDQTFGSAKKITLLLSTDWTHVLS